ncbi:MAG: EamA family transporter [Verrucomicrobiales bacterium]|nr:EamA family transporter [Verrucomicrobiales bacterium]
MFKFVVILLVGLMLEAIGVVLLSRGLKRIGDMERVSVSEVVRVVKAGATEPSILAGVAFEAAFFGILIYLLGRADVSLVWPLTSLGFVITTFAARFYLHETVSGLRWAGVLLIVLGAGLVSWSEQGKKQAAASPASDARLANANSPPAHPPSP